MADIAVVHMDLESKGGGEAVAMNVLEALQDDHDVRLVSLTSPDLAGLNDYFNTAVEDVTVERAGVLAPWLHDRFGIQYYVLQNALLGRFARRHRDEFDLLVSTINELGLGPDSVQYIHFPFDWTVSLDGREHIFHPTIEEDSVYERLCTTVGSIHPEELRESLLLANSSWTADAVEEAYGTRPHVVYPPVDTRDFEERPWDERESGFVTIGRIERSKRIKELVRVVDGLRERGHGVHLHVIGPTVDEEYCREVGAMAEERPYVRIEGEVSRDELVECISSHRYGIHGKEYEHFGMAVAELAAGGTIPFTPANGGQGVVVNDDKRLLFESVDDAIEKADAVLSDPTLQSALRGRKAEITRRFGRRRFHDEVRAHVAETLGTPAPDAPDAPEDPPDAAPRHDD